MAEEVEMELEGDGSILTNLRIVFAVVIEIITGIISGVLGKTS